MKKIVFFPYHPDLWTVIEHIAALRDYEVCGFLSYKEDAERIEALNEAVGAANTSEDERIRSCDAVILHDNYRGFKPDKYYRIIDDAAGYGKEILVTPLAETQLDLRSREGMYGLLERLPDGMEDIDYDYAKNKEVKIHRIAVPIVGVFGQGRPQRSLLSDK